MADVEWIENIKRIVIQAIEAGDPCDVIPGTVIKENPIEIQIDQKTILSKSQVILPKQFTDHEEGMDIPGVGEVSVTVKNRLKSGERVLLLQKRGGQQYVVIGTW
ncbi:DUF2577 domain-containing protein [Clostridium sp. Marseille-P2415]|uniref:DUF2577 domain-containing protein n=1 Tax=Clostridium sp. Marseille-P2415 TaxID=1805471 RepID=UPI00098843E3|nr:DUF2577 domain-containing protein [Clostridium sp. Marseille-P2415]